MSETVRLLSRRQAERPPGRFPKHEQALPKFRIRAITIAMGRVQALNEVERDTSDEIVIASDKSQDDPIRMGLASGTRLYTTEDEGAGNFFISNGRNPLKSLDSKK